MFSFRKHICQLMMKRNGKKNSFNSKPFFSHWKTNPCGVLISYYGTKKLEVINEKCHNYGRILLSEINIDDSLFLLINIYKANNESDQLKTLLLWLRWDSWLCWGYSKQKCNFRRWFQCNFWLFPWNASGETKFEKTLFINQKQFK